MQFQTLGVGNWLKSQDFFKKLQDITILETKTKISSKQQN